jgi:two-component system, OmpR family, sensor kinase
MHEQPSTGFVRGLRARAARLRWVPSSLRARVLASIIGLLALSTALLVGVSYVVLDIRLDQRIDDDLTQEAAELRRLASGDDPETGRPFGTDVRRLFEVYFDRNVPSRNEAFAAFVDGRPFLHTRQAVPQRLDSDPDLVARWASVTEPSRGSVSTPAGRIDYLAVPLVVDESTRGVFVAGIFSDRLQDDYDRAVFAAAAAGLLVLLVGSLLAWRLADRIVDPVGRLTRTARSISGSNLSRRIEVTGHDEVAQLATTFNAMLDRLQRAFASQREFLDDAGHELRTPLTIVSGHLELLPDDPAEREQTLALVADELERMGRIVDDLLLLAKHEQPDFLQLSPVELAPLLDELHSKAAALGPREREWIVERRDRGIVVADRQRLTQAMLQLAHNAIVHGGGGPIFLGCAMHETEARLWVRDVGPGIPTAEQGRMFDRLRQGTAARRGDGTGLGLAIVRAIAEAHGGRVELDSAPGRGATFAIVVPVDQPVEGER